MIRHFREVIFNCYQETGMKLQNFIHCVALTFRVAKGLAKEIIYEMFTANLLSVELIELRDFGCEGCSTDVTKFSKKSCNPRECLVLIRIKPNAVVEAIQDEVRECLALQREYPHECIERTIKRLSLPKTSAKIITQAIAELDYEFVLRVLNEKLASIEMAMQHAREQIAMATERLKQERDEAELKTILEKINALQTDSPELIMTALSTQEYGKFMIMKAKGEIVYDFTEKRWKHISKI